MKTIAVIPARYASTRLPGKPLLMIGNKPMIQHVYEQVKKCSLVDRIIIATDNEQIFNTVKNFGGEVMMTSKNHQSGSDRIAEVIKKISREPVKYDFVLNVQGDEPLVSPSLLKKIIVEFHKNKGLNIITPVCKIKDISELFSPNFAKVVFSRDNFALYFTRSPVPFVRDKFSSQQSTVRGQGKNINFDFSVHNLQSIINNGTFYRHIGIYGYKCDFLLKYVKLPQGKLEKLEKLEQLRVLEHGYKIKVVIVKEAPISVDTEEDLLKVRKIVRN